MPEMTYAEATLLQAQNNRISELEAEIERLKTLADNQAEMILRLEMGGYKADAERYQWLRDQVMDGYWACGPCEIIDSWGETHVHWSDGGLALDADIDAARESA